MADKGATDKGARAAKGAKLLVDLAAGDTVYGDVYLRRARSLLAEVLTRSQYGALKGIQRDIDETVKQCKQATVTQDWQRVETLATHADQLRQRAIESAPLRDLGAQVYDATGVAIDPFSPGFDFLPGGERDLAEVRERVVAGLKTMAADDEPMSSFYRSRQAYFAGLAIESKRAEAGPTKSRSIAELQQLAAQAAQRGDIAQLRRYAQEIRELEAQAPKKETTEKVARDEPAGAAAYRCPVDLATPLPPEVAERARALGLAAARTEPLPQGASLHTYVAERIWSPDFEAERSESEGTLRAEAAVDEAGLPPEVSDAVKVLVGQFLRNPFVNSGGARYFPRLAAESVLIEDFPEDREAPDGELVRALGLPGRRGLARVQIDDALLENGPTVLQERLHLDPLEFRLVCIPHDLYMRFGRDHGWGQHQQWTHFDGYQVLRGGQLRALIGGDVRYGGLSDLLSIGLADQRQSVIARFAVIRRARHVARWI
jgi:hypothetical protein